MTTKMIVRNPIGLFLALFSAVCLALPAQAKGEPATESSTNPGLSKRLQFFHILTV